MRKGNLSDSSNPNKYAFDSYAIIAYLNHELAYEKVEKLLEQARLGEVKIYISLMNLGEVMYYLLKQRDEKEAIKILEKVKNLPIDIVQVDERFVWEAAKIKAKGGLSYADSFVLATAIQFKAPIVTGDPEFKKFEKMVKIEWLLTKSKTI